MVQKVLSFHYIFFASAWMLLNSHVNMLEIILQDFLWSDGKRNKKRHCVKWEWCCQIRSQGGLGLKDIKAQGLVLASK